MAGSDAVSRPPPTSRYDQVSGPIPAALIAGQYKITALAGSITGGTATPLINGVEISALSTNTGNVFLGGSTVTTTADGTGNGWILEPGNSKFIAIADLSKVYAIGTANDVISWGGN